MAERQRNEAELWQPTAPPPACEEQHAPPVFVQINTPQTTENSLNKKRNNMALIGFCLGVGAVFLNPLAALSIAALVLGVITLKQFGSSAEKRYWMSLTAIILGALNTLIYFVSVVIGLVGSVLLAPLISLLVEELIYSLIGAL